MSHFTRIRTKITNGPTLREALTRLGYRVEAAGRGVAGYSGQRADAEFKIRPGRGHHEISFVPSAEGYTIVADWWGLPGLDRDAFARRVTQQYALVGTLATLAARGFTVDEQVQEHDGEIRLVLRRTVGV